MKSFDEIKSELKKIHLQYSEIINVDEEHERRLTGLHINCASILKNQVMETLKKIVGEGYAITYFGNEYEFFKIEKI